MLNQTKVAVAAGALIVGFTWLGVGCTIKEVDPSDDRTTSNAASSSSSGSTTTTSGSGSGSSSSGGAGGSSPECVGVEGVGLPQEACNMMAITPEEFGGAAASNCGEDSMQPPPGHALCLTAFDVFTPGSFQNLQACLDTIGVEPANACDEDQVFDCLDKMYAEACSQPEMDVVCAEFADSCAMAKQSFAIAQCSEDLAPLSQFGLEVYEDCVNDAPEEQTCQQAHNECAGSASGG